MSTARKVHLIALAMMVWLGSPSPPVRAAAMGTAFTYQGSLQNPPGTPYSGTCDFSFGLYESAAGALVPVTAPAVNPTTIIPVQVTGGVFTTTMDFGINAINGEDRWLEISVCCPSGPGCPLILLSPRVRLNPVPHALALPGLYTQQNATSHNLIGGFFGNTVAGGVYGATIGGGGSNGAVNSVTDIYGTVGGGNSNTASGDSSTVGGGGFNTVSGSGSTVGGGGANIAGSVCVGGPNNYQRCFSNVDCPGGVCPPPEAYSTVGGGGGNRAIGEYSTVGGGSQNLASGRWSTVGGGDQTQANGIWSTVGGGFGTGAFGEGSTVGGGELTHAVGDNSTVGGGNDNNAIASNSTIGGGDGNRAEASNSTVGGGNGNITTGFFSTIGGGNGNDGIGTGSTVGGGSNNTAFGLYATVPGGLLNWAGGEYSFAAGRRAKANHNGTIVWADSQNADFSSTNLNQFLIRAAGGVGIGINAPAHPLHMASGAHCTAGGVWTNASSKELKENLAAVNVRHVLDRVVDLPIRFWNYKNEDAAITHLGPMAEQFHEQFGLGGDNKSIGTIDADGVALAAIQGLYEIVQEKDCEIDELREQKTREVEELRSEISNLKAMFGKLAAQQNGGGR